MVLILTKRQNLAMGVEGNYEYFQYLDFAHVMVYFIHRIKIKKRELLIKTKSKNICLVNILL